jgi:hypothetical protein
MKGMRVRDLFQQLQVTQVELMRAYQVTLLYREYKGISSSCRSRRWSSCARTRSPSCTENIEEYPAAAGHAGGAHARVPGHHPVQRIEEHPAAAGHAGGAHARVPGHHPVQRIEEHPVRWVVF